MFVIMQSLDNLKSDEKKTNNIPQNIGQTMTHAGVAITVTSITDIVVFAVGSSTVRIILRNFREINFKKKRLPTHKHNPCCFFRNCQACNHFVYTAPLEFLLFLYFKPHFL